MNKSDPQFNNIMNNAITVSITCFFRSNRSPPSSFTSHQHHQRQLWTSSIIMSRSRGVELYLGAVLEVCHGLEDPWAGGKGGEEGGECAAPAPLFPAVPARVGEHRQVGAVQPAHNHVQQYLFINKKKVCQHPNGSSFKNDQHQNTIDRFPSKSIFM